MKYIDGKIGWMLLLVTLGPMATFHQSPVAKIMIFFAYACFLGSFVPGIFGLGHALAAIRLRGDHAKLALCGLVGAGAQLGVGIALIVINLWHN